MYTCTSRLVETPASRLSPDLRARTKITSALRVRGIDAVGRIVIVAQPVLSVWTSGAPRVQPYGRPSAWTSGPGIEKPRVSETWKRAVKGARDASAVGENLTLSTTSRSGG